MKIHAFQKQLGKFLVKYGNLLDKNVKVKFSITFSLEVLLFGATMGIGFLILNGIYIIVFGFILVISLYLLYGAIAEFTKALLSTIGNYFIKISQTARFSAKVVDQSQSNSLDKKYVIQISNQEWFADCENVSCGVGLVGHVSDYEDIQIAKTFDESNKNRFPIGSGGSGIWTDNDSAKIDIPRKSGRFLKFIKICFSENKFYASLTDYGKDKLIEIPCGVGKHLFLINISGDIKNGNFYCSFKVEVVYRGKNDVELKIENEQIAVNISQRKQEKIVSLWS